MAFTHAKNARLWFDQYELTNYFTEFQMQAKAGTAETTVFGRGAKTYIGGLKEGTITAKGYFGASSTDLEDPEMSAALGRQTNMAVTFIPSGITAAGTRCVVAYAAETDYQVSSPVTGVVATSISAQADSGLSTGVVLYDPTTAIITATTTNGTSVEDFNGLSTSGGFVANLHVITLTGTGTPELTCIIQSSPDGSTWTTLAAFNPTVAGGLTPAEITAPGAYSAFVTYGNLVQAYLRAVIVTAGSTISTTLLVSAARQ